MNQLYQYSTMGALVGGMFEGVFKMKDVISTGNYGIGTLDGLDGELIVVDGKPYSIDSTGKVRLVDDEETTPFASMTQFTPDIRKTINEALSKEILDQKMVEAVSGMNYFHTVKITGKFKLIKARSVKKQHPPYPKLVEAVKEQGYFDFEETEGTLFGFYTPHFIQGIGVGGYHVHYLSDDLTQGGHVFDYIVEHAEVEIQLLDNVQMKMPLTERYRTNDLNNPDMLKDIEASE